MTKLTRTIALVLSLMFVIAFASPMVTMAASLDDISNGSSSSSDGSGSDSSSGAISDYLNDYTPITNDNMAKASTLASPVANFLGTVAGAIVIVVEAAIVVVTALDLAYIGLPFTRSLLNPNYSSAPQGGGGMGGMGMGGGFGGGYGRMGGMGMGMGGGMAGQAQPQGGLHRQWVSDEAVQCVMLAQPQQPQGGGMGMGMGGMGMMGGMGAQQQAPQPTRSVIATYLKKRSVFIVLFTIGAILLTSSILTHSGINLAELLMKVINKGNNMVSNVQIQ